MSATTQLCRGTQHVGVQALSMAKSSSFMLAMSKVPHMQRGSCWETSGCKCFPALVRPANMQGQTDTSACCQTQCASQRRLSNAHRMAALETAWRVDRKQWCISKLPAADRPRLKQAAQNQNC